MKIMFFVQNVSIYMNFEGTGDIHGQPYNFYLLFKKKRKKYLYLNIGNKNGNIGIGPILKSNSTSF